MLSASILFGAVRVNPTDILLIPEGGYQKNDALTC